MSRHKKKPRKIGAFKMGATGLEPNNAPKQKKPVLTGFLNFPVNTGFFNIKTFYEHTMIL